MDNKKIKKYERITKITGILIGLVLVLGTSYAVFQTVTRSEETNTISAGKLDVQIENEKDEILLENSYPISEEEGLKQSPYTFEIVNKGSINAEYDLYIEIEESTTLPTDVVRYYLTVEEEGQEKIVTEKARLISQEETKEREGKTLYKIDTKYIDTTKTNKYKLYLWIDHEATTEQATNKYFEARVVVDAVQIYDKNRLVKQIDVSASGDNSVLAYMYADGTVYIKGKGTMVSDLSDTIVYDKDESIILNCYKKVLTSMGYDVSHITSMEELETYWNELASSNENLSNEFDEALTVVIAKETLEEMGQDTSNITDMNSLMNYLMEIGYMDEEGYPTEIGEEFFTKFDEKYNTNFSTDPIPAKKIILEDGIENIPSGLFNYNEDITEVRIPTSVKRIDDRAFEGCRGLKEITIPKSVTSIGAYAFESCNSLSTINIEGNNLSIGNSAFRECAKLNTVNMKGVSSIGTYAFYHCTSLTNITIPNSVTSIGDFTFSECQSLTSITIPKSVTSIGNGAFAYCNSLSIMNIEGNNLSIGNSAIYNCTKLNTVNMKGVSSIGDYAFQNCTSLTNITIPKSVTSIGNGAFAGCTSLTTIDIPDSVTSIGSWAFEFVGNINYNGSLSGTFGARARNGYVEGDYVYTDSSKTNLAAYCGKESVVIIPNSVTSIGYRAFYNCTSLTTIEIPNSVTSIGSYAFENCTNLTTIDIPNSVTSIGNGAFYKCTSLTTIEIPNSVTSIGSSAFFGCASLTQINVDENNQNYTSVDGVLFNKEQTTILKYPEGKKETSYTIPSSVTKLESNVFRDCKNLEKLEIPTSVIRIESSAFEDCTNIKEITIPNSVEYVEWRAFGDWTSSQTINIDNTEAYVNANWSSSWKSMCSAQINYLRS